MLLLPETMRILRIAPLLLIAAVAACSENKGPTPTCASTCSDRQVCDVSSSPPRCKCREERTGLDCAGCARGYTLTAEGACLPPVINCKQNPTVCGSHGTCISEGISSLDRCDCKPGYTGASCQTCTTGYQDNDNNGLCTVACALTTCTGLLSCTDSTGTARCSCPGNRTGSNCDQCASGWMLRASDGTCVQTCASSGSSCGSKKMCDATQGLCVCRPEYTGDSCTACAPGYQDNNGDGICTAACATTTCAMGQVCSDSTGTARCACPSNRTGTNCDQCPSGWVLRAADNTCVQTCAATSCGARRYCDDGAATPVCTCQTPYAGADCAACASGYTLDGSGQCSRPAPAGTTLIAAARSQNAEYLVALDPTAGTVTPLRPLPGLANQRLASDFATRTLYAASGSGLFRFDAATAGFIAVASVQSVGSTSFSGGALYTLGQLSPYLLKRVDPATGAVSDIGPTNLASSQGAVVGLAFEPGGTLLYARPPTTGGNSAELVRIDPATAVATTLGPLTIEPTNGTRLRPVDGRLAIAFDAGGKLFLATHLGRSGEDILAEHCRKLAAGLGYEGYEQAPLTTAEINYNGIGAGLTRVLGSKNPSGKEIIAYASYGRRTNPKAILRIEPANAEAFVCVSTYEEVLELQIPMATARFAAIALAGSRPTLTLAVEGTVPPVTRPTLHVYSSTSGSVAPAFNGGAGGYQFSKVYTAAEWSALRLPSYASVFDSDDGAPSVLLEVNLATRAVTRIKSWKDVELLPSIAAWAP
jgi:hypothetical protein